MKKTRIILSILVTFIMILSIVPYSAFAVDGTIVEINSANDLKLFAQKVNDGDTYEGVTVVLKKDIELDADQNWIPIGNGTRSESGYEGDAFKGTFEGNGRTVSGLAIKQTSGNKDDSLGLFGVVDGGAVRNLVLKDVEIDAPYSECSGGAIGLMVNGASAERITVSGSVNAFSGVGGIAGRMSVSGTVSYCTSKAVISAAGSCAGGIVGAACYTESGKELSIKRCVNNGKVENAGGMTGGIAGLSSANIVNCENKGSVTGCGRGIGGISGEQQSYGSVTGCINSADIANEDAGGCGTGGIIGCISYNGSADEYHMKKTVKVTGNTNAGTIDGGDDGGGIIGVLYNAAEIACNENNAVFIEGETFAAGIAGNIRKDKVTAGSIEERSISVYNNVSATSEGNLTGSCKDKYVYNDDSTISDRIKENSDRWAACIGKRKYTTIDAAVAAAAKGGTIEILDTGESGNLNVAEGIEILNNTDHTITVNGISIEPGAAFHGSIVRVDRVEPTCDEDGNILYWYCEQCGKYFADKEGTKQISDADTVIAAEGHSYKDGICTECGSKADESGSMDTETDTGDDMNIWLPVVLIIIALAVAAVLIFTRKKK